MAGVATAVVGGVGIASSLYGASKNAKAQSKAMGQQERMAQQDLDFRRGMYNRYLGLYGPVEEQLAKEAQSSQPLDYEQNQAQIKQQYANALRNIGTNMGMRGIAGSGLDIGAMRGAALGQAGELSGAYAQGLMNRRNLGLGLTSRNQIMQSGMNTGAGFQNMSNMYGNRSDQYGRASAAGWNNLGTSLGELGAGLAAMNKPKKDTAYGTSGSSAEGSQTGPFGTNSAWASTAPKLY